MNSELEQGRFEGQVLQKLDDLTLKVDMIRKGLYGEVGIDPRLRKVEEIQASQKGFVAFVALISSFIGGMITLVVHFMWNRR